MVALALWCDGWSVGVRDDDQGACYWLGSGAAWCCWGRLDLSVVLLALPWLVVISNPIAGRPFNVSTAVGRGASGGVFVCAPPRARSAGVRPFVMPACVSLCWLTSPRRLGDDVCSRSRAFVDAIRAGRGERCLRVVTFAERPRLDEAYDGTTGGAAHDEGRGVLRHPGAGVAWACALALSFAYGLFPPGALRRVLLIC